MAANRNVHLAKKVHHLVARNAEFARQIVYSKLAQTLLLLTAVRHRRRAERPNPLCQTSVYNAYHRRRIAPGRRAELDSRRSRENQDSAGPQQRQHFIQTVNRSVRRRNSELQLAAPCRLPYLLNTHYRPASANPEADETEELARLSGFHSVTPSSYLPGRLPQPGFRLRTPSRCSPRHPLR
jgi:hypothetical protein